MIYLAETSHSVQGYFLGATVQVPMSLLGSRAELQTYNPALRGAATYGSALAFRHRSPGPSTREAPQHGRVRRLKATIEYGVVPTASEVC